MEPPSILGQLIYSAETLEVEGWCWSSDAPSDRQVVEIFAGDQFIAAIVAGWMDQRLMRAGVGDGRHAFSLTLPASPEGYRELSARERRSGQEFARIDCEKPAAFDPLSSRLDWMARTAHDLQARIGILMNAREPARAVRAPGLYPTRTVASPRRLSAKPIGVAMDRLREVCPGLVVPKVAEPVASIIIRADDAASCAEAIFAIAPAMAALQGEIIVLDAGKDPSATLLPSHLINIHYIFDKNAGAAAAAGNLAAAAARGRILVFLDDTGRRPSVPALMQLVAACRCAPRLLLGAPYADLLARIAPAAIAAERHAISSLGLRLCMPRQAFLELGQFDFHGADTVGIECADMALKADMAGFPRENWREPPRPGPLQPGRRTSAIPSDEDRTVSIEALVSFHARWGPRAAA
jgi:hypothetical protein